MLQPLFILFVFLFFVIDNTVKVPGEIYSTTLSDTLIIPARELDSIYVSQKKGKIIIEGPTTKVSQKYGGYPPFIQEVTKCFPCEKDSVSVKQENKVPN